MYLILSSGNLLWVLAWASLELEMLPQHGQRLLHPKTTNKNKLNKLHGPWNRGEHSVPLTFVKSKKIFPFSLGVCPF